MPRTRRVTKRQAEQVLRNIRKRFAPWITEGDGPDLVMDWQPMTWSSDSGGQVFDPRPTILWEGGPFEWACLDPAGDIEEGSGFRLPPLPEVDGVRTEPWASYALCIYRED